MCSIVLASQSVYRQALLKRLNLTFVCRPANINEKPHPNETPTALVRRLAEEKARTASIENSTELIIGSDQVAVLDARIFGKPLDLEHAKQQLAAASGRCVTFFTGLAVFNNTTSTCQVDCISFEVYFRILSAATIERYLIAEQPFDCAGSFKAEGLGISLFERMQGADPTSLVGLPLIRLVDMLLAEGIVIP